MHLTQLRLHNFRSYGQLALMPPPGLTVFVGENGAGKTNLLEAIHLCCLGRSHRTTNDQDMIRTAATPVQCMPLCSARDVWMRSGCGFTSSSVSAS